MQSAIAMEKEEISFKSLGTDINIKLFFPEEYEVDTRERIVKDAIETYKKYNFRLSRFDSESEISKLNKCIGKWQNVSSELSLLLKKIIFYNKETGGIFDPRILTELEDRGYNKDFSLIKRTKTSKQKNSGDVFGSPLEKEIVFKRQEVKISRRIDVTGLAKGYITDKAVELLRDQDLTDFLVDSGGDMFCAGKNLSKNRDWLVSLEGYPEDKFMIKLSDKAIATSGTSRRRWEKNGKEVHHLINPFNPKESDFSLRSVSVVANSVEEADVWAKTLFILGRERGLQEAEERNIAAFFLNSRGNLYISRSSKSFIEKK